MNNRRLSFRCLATAGLGLLLLVCSASVLAGGATSQRIANPTGGGVANGSDGLRPTWGSNSQFQVRHLNSDQVYNTGATPTTGTLYNGVFLRVDRGAGAVRVYNNSDNATGAPFLQFTQVSQSALGGTGSLAQPYTTTTVLRPNNAADTGITVTIIDSYITPQVWFTRRVELSGMPASGAVIKFYQNVDTYLQGGDAGPGFVRTTAGSPASVPDFVGVTKGAQIEALWHTFSSDTPIWDRYFTGNYTFPQALICNSTTTTTNPCTTGTGNLNNAVDTNAATDNGMAAQWNIPAGAATHAVEYRITFGTGAVDLTKAFVPAFIAPGGISTLTFNLANRTTSPATGAGFRDTLPAGLTVAAVPNVRTNCPSGGTIGTTLPSGMAVTAAAGSNLIQVTNASLAAGTASTPLNCQVLVNVTGTAVGNYANTSANIGSLTNVVNLVDSEVLSIVTPQLTVAKAVNGSLVAGQSGVAADGHYTLTITNTGSVATNGAISIQEILPTGVTLVQATSTAGSITCTGGLPATGTVNCTFTPSSPIAANASASVRLNVAVAASASGTLTNRVGVAGGGDPDALPNCATATNAQCASVGGTVDTRANLSITKTGSTSVVAGQQVTYTLAVANNGPSNATGVVISDPTPAGLTFVSASGACSGGFPCAIGNLASGGTVSINVVYTVASNFSGAQVSNIASVAATTTDPDNGNNSSTATTTVTASANLAIAKSGPASATPGQTVSYTLAVSNTGPSHAASVVLDDPTPAGLAFVSASAPCAAGFPCNLGSIAPGSGAAVTVTFSVPANRTTPISNTATIASNTPDPVNGNNSSTVTTPLAPSSDLSIVKSGPASVAPGENVTYTLTVENDGPSDATVATLDDPTPAGLSFVSAGAPCSGGFPCNLGSIANGASRTVTVTFAVPGNHTGSIVNTATVASPFDIDASNNSSSVTTPVAARANLRVAKTGPASATSGQNVSYTLDVANAGPSDASVTLDDPTPAGLVFVSATAPCAGGFPCNLGTMAADATRSITVTFAVPSDHDGSIANTATVSSTAADPDAADNSSTVVTPVSAIAELSVMKTGPASATPGQNVSYSLLVGNIGPSDATAVVLDDPTPAGLAFVSANAPCSGGFPCNLGTLENGGSRLITVVFSVPSDHTGNITNVATVTSSTTDPDATTNTSTVVTPTLGSANLSLVKTGPAAATPGQNVSYTLAVANAGPSTASAVVLDDPTPAGLDFVSASAPCAAGFPCNLGDIAAGGNASVTVTFAVPADHSGSITNAASVTSPTSDPDTDGNTSTVTTPVAASADLRIVKTGPASATPGQTVAYTLALSNLGPSDAPSVTLDDPTPAGLSFVSASASCAGGFPCAFGTLAAGANASVTVTFAVPADHSGGIVNTATIASPASDPDGSSNSSTVTTPVAASANLGLVKTGPATATPGSTVTYTLTVGNTGPSDAASVTLDDPTPAGLAFVSATAPCTGGFPCALGTVVAGGSVSVNVTFAVPAGHAATIVNSASVSSTTTDPDPAGNTSTVTTPLAASANLGLTKTGPAAATPGQTVSYTLAVSNIGPSDAEAVVLDDPTPAGLTYVSASAPCASGFPCVLGALAAGSNASVTVTFAVPANHSGPIVNTANVTSTTTDPDPAGNTSTVTTPTVASADIAMGKTVDNAAPNVGESVTFLVTATNAGPSDATGLVIGDVLPAGLGFVSAVPTQGTYDPGTGVWTVGALALDDDASLTIIATVDAPGTLTNVVTVLAAGQSDPTPGNNSATASVDAQASSDVGITKTVDDATPNLGSTVSFLVVVSNNGPNDATGVLVSDPLPAGLAFVSATPTQGSYDPATGVWSVGALANGAQRQLTIMATVQGTDPVTNTATLVAQDQYDPAAGNNSASASLSGQAADIGIGKTVDDSTPSVGDIVAFTVTATNAGPSAATGVVVTDLLDADFEFLAATPSQGTYDDATGVWTIGTLAASGPGASASLVVSARVLQDGALQNTASRTASDQTDIDASNDVATVDLVAAPSANLALVKSAPSAVLAGETITYTLALSNSGPSAAQGVTLDDPTPAGLVFVSASAPCASGFPCTLGTLAAGADVTVTATYTVPAGSNLTQVVNTASVASTTPDPDTTDNGDSTATAIGSSADLSLVKSGPANATPGEQVTYQLAIGNDGPSDAANAMLDDPTPAGLVFVSATAPCAAGFPCALGTIAANDDITVNVTFAVPADHAGDIVNTATVTSTTTDPDSTGNSSTVTTPLVASADLSVAKSGPASATPGENVTYTLAVSNTGPSDASTVSLDDPTPAGLVFVSASAPCAAGFPCALGTLAAGANVSIDVTFSIPADHAGAIVNTATISSPTADPDNAGNSSTVTTPLAASADLSVVKSGPATATPGENVTYTLAVSNAGPSDASTVSLDDPTPAGLVFVSASAPCAAGFPCALGTLAAGANISIDVTFSVPADHNDAIVNTATISSPTADPDNAGNSSTVTTPLAASADLSVVKSGPANATPGENVTYTLAVSNAGPSDASTVSLDDPTPAGLVFVSASAPCAAGLPCALGTLAAGANISIDVTFSVPADHNDAIVNTATISSPTSDPDNAGNSSTVTTPLAASADLSVVKSGPATATPGENVTYTLAVSNVGPSDASTVSLDDPTPAGLVFVSASTPCATGFPCALGTLAAGANISIDVTFSVPADHATAIVNTATISSATSDPDNAGNSSTVTTPLAASADLSVVKSGPASATPGENVTYTLAVSNVGPSDASTVSLDDPTPAGLVFVSASTPCATGFPCALGTLAAGANISIDVTFSVPADHATAIVNTATISSATADPDAAGNSSTVTTPLTGSADLGIVKTGPASATPGSTVGYTLAVTNTGPSDAADVMLDDPTPAGLDFVSASAPCDAGFPCALGTLASSSSLSIDVTFAVPADHADSIVNTATVTASTSDPDNDSNTSTVTTPLAGSADLVLVKSGPAVATPGGEVTYSLALGNAGPSDAAAVTLDDPTPAGLVFVSATAPCASGFPCALGTLAAGANVTVDVVFSVPADHADAIVNTATAASTTPDPDADTNTSTVTTPLGSSADLRLVKTGPAAATPGEQVTYTLALSNAGPSDAAGVTLDDPTPAGLTFVSATAPCAAGFPCSLGTLAADATRSVDVTFAVPADHADSIVNTATVSSSTSDPDSDSNTSTVTTPLAGSANLSIEKTGPAAGTPGESLVYTLVVTNAGPSDASDVVLDDPTPAGLVFVSAGAPCEAGFPCTLGMLANGDSVTVAATFDVPADYAGADPIVNVASIGAATPDPDAADNSSTVSTALDARANLSLLKTGPAAVSPGEEVAYRFVITNAGPSAATAVVLDDVLPEGLSLVSSTACSTGFPCDLGTLAADASVTVDAVFALSADVEAGSISNTATVTSDITDPDPADNTSTATTDVDPLIADLTLTKTGPASTMRGQTIDYVLTVRNAGPDAAVDTVLDDPTPSGLDFVSADGVCSDGFPCDLGTLEAGQDVVVAVRFTLPASYAGPSDIVNVATVTSATSDPTPANNASTASTVVGTPSAPPPPMINAIPVDSRWMLLLMALLLAGVGLYTQRTRD